MLAREILLERPQAFKGGKCNDHVTMTPYLGRKTYDAGIAAILAMYHFPTTTSVTSTSPILWNRLLLASCATLALSYRLSRPVHVIYIGVSAMCTGRSIKRYWWQSSKKQGSHKAAVDGTACLHDQTYHRCSGKAWISSVMHPQVITWCLGSVVLLQGAAYFRQTHCAAWCSNPAKLRTDDCSVSLAATTII